MINLDKWKSPFLNKNNSQKIYEEINLKNLNKINNQKIENISQKRQFFDKKKKLDSIFITNDYENHNKKICFENNHQILFKYFNQNKNEYFSIINEFNRLRNISQKVLIERKYSQIFLNNDLEFSLKIKNI